MNYGVNYELLYEQLWTAGFSSWVEQLRQKSSDWFSHHGDYARWHQALSNLPALNHVTGLLHQPVVTVDGHCENPRQLKKALQGLSPWRKGPYQIVDTYIDAEWRSDYKWNRVKPHLKSLCGKRLLDVGCGNGYHCWRMLAEAPRLVVGVEPSVLFNLQFQAIQHYLNRPEIYLLPLTVEALPADMGWFDTVFSMGVFYHRKSPIEHLMKLKSLLVPGGQLCLETLVIDGGPSAMLMPENRYARMSNVWFIPSSEALAHWLRRCGFEAVQIVNCAITTTEEQRSTAWMPYESLANRLDVNNNERTVEGLPAPRRAVLMANRPSSSG